MAYTEEDVIAGMMAVIGHTSYADAARYLQSDGREINEETLRRWCRETKTVQFEKMRDEWAGQIEAQLANNLLDNARLAAQVERQAIEATKDSLDNKTAREPAKIARDLSQVKAQSVDKRLALQGRPTQISERRGISEIVKALVGMRVAVIEEAEVVPDATAASLRPPDSASQGPQHLQEGVGASESAPEVSSRRLEAVN
jgi:hypothetical protein